MNIRILLSKWKRLVDPRFFPSKWLLSMVGVRDCNKLISEHTVRPCEHVDTPEIMDMELTPAARGIKKATHVIPAVEAYLLKDVYFCALKNDVFNLLLCDKRKIIKDFCNSMDEVKYISWAPLYFSKKGERLRGVWTSLRSISNNHGHTLLDNLPRITALTLENLKSPRQVNLLVAGDLTPFESYALERLLPSSVQINHVQSCRIHSIEEYLLLSNPREKRFGGYLPDWYLTYFRERMLPSRPRCRTKRIYISRGNAGMRRMLNEEEVVSILENYGFKRYYLENLSPQEEIELFYDAEAVVGPAGSGMFNVIFSENIKVLDLYPTPYLRPETYFLSKSLGHDYRYSYSSENNFSSDFRCDVKIVREWLRDIGLN